MSFKSLHTVIKIVYNVLGKEGGNGRKKKKKKDDEWIQIALDFSQSARKNRETTLKFVDKLGSERCKLMIRFSGQWQFNDKLYETNR